MSDSSNIGNNCKAKLHVKEQTKTNTVPIKIVDTNYSNNKDKVVIGMGLATSVPAILDSQNLTMAGHCLYHISILKHLKRR